MENITLGNLGSLTPAQAITLIYIGYYDRAPDPVGHDFWTNLVINKPRVEEREGRAVDGAILPGEDGIWGLDDIGSDFATQRETKDIYPFFENPTSATQIQLTAFINGIYQNLFGRPADQEGLNFYVPILTNSVGNVPGSLSVGEIIVEIAKGARNTADGQDLALLQNKIAIGTAWLEAARPGVVTLDYENNLAAKASAKATVKSVTSEQSTVDAANAAISSFFDPGGQAVTVNLTTANDQPGGGGGGADTQGSSGDDSYTATIQTTGSTLQSTDIIAAGDGVDTLTVRIVSLSGAQTVAPVATGLENIVINNQATSGDFRLNFTDISGAAEVTAARNANTSVGTRFINLDTDTKIRIVDNDGFTTAHFKGDRSASTTDGVTLYIEDSGTENRSAIFTTANEASTDNDQSFEIAEIETGGTTRSFVDMPRMALDSLIVTGTQTLSLEDTSSAFSTLKSADASGMTGGGLNLDAAGNNQAAFSFLGSAQDDMLVLNRNLFNTSNTLSLDGGGGDMDVLAVESFNSLNATSVNAANNFEFLMSTGSTTSLNASDFTKINNFIFDGQTTNQGRLNITGITAADNFIFTSDQGRGDETVRFSGQNAGTSMTFELRAESAAGGHVRLFSSTNSGNDVAAIGFGNGNISAVQIISSGSNTNANVIRGVDTGSNMYYAFDNQNGPSTFAISGGQALTITAEAGVTLNASSDERGFHSAVNVDGSNATGALRIAGSGTSDVLTGGSGDDILYGMGGNNVLTGGAGADQFRFSDFSGKGILQDFTIGEDKIGLQRVDFQNTAASRAGTTLNPNDYVENVSSISQLSAAENNKVVELQLGASQTQITTTTGGASNTYVLVFNTTSGKGELWFDNNWSDTANRTLTAEFDTITDLVGLTGLSNTEFVEYIF